MKGLVYHGARDIRFETFPDAKIEDSRDAIVKMTRCAICGSDLHIYHGEGFGGLPGSYCVGHEAIGEVVEVGRGVNRVKVGDHVMIPASVGCGQCAPCLAGNVNLCRNGLMACYGLSARLQGCQAEAIRVPVADFNSAPMPEGLTADQALMLTDNLPTAWYGLSGARIKPGQDIAVVGLGPIGLMAVEGAFVQGAGRVFAIDRVPERRAIAEKLGALALDGIEAVARIGELTKGKMAEAAVECVGADATINLAMEVVGRQGIVSAIGVSQTREFPINMQMAFFKSLRFQIGTCSVQEQLTELIPLIQSGRLHPERFISHTMPLSEGAEAYRLFDARTDGALKMVMTA